MCISITESRNVFLVSCGVFLLCLALYCQTGSSGTGTAAWVALCDGAIELVDVFMSRLGSEDEQSEALQVGYVARRFSRMPMFPYIQL